MKADQCSGLFESDAIFIIYIDAFEFAARGVDHDYRRRHFCLGDLVSDFPCFADVLEHYAESELLLQTQRRHDVVVAVRMKMYDAFLVEHLDESFHREVAWRQF